MLGMRHEVNELDVGPPRHLYFLQLDVVLSQDSSRPPPPQSSWTIDTIWDMVRRDTPNVKDCVILGPEKSTGKHQNKSTGIQMSPRHPESRGTTTATQTTNKKAPQGSGTQTIPPPSCKKLTSTGGTQTSPPKNPHRQVDQGQLDCNEESQLANTTSSKGKKTKKSISKAPPHPGPSTGPAVGPRNYFTSRNLGTGRPTIQCTACGEYSHWRRECPYDNYCTTCKNHDHATHMCRAHRQTNNNPGQQDQQSPQICVYCGSPEHSSSNCHRRPWDNREQPNSTPNFLRRDQQANSKILGNATGRTASMGANTQAHPPQS